MMKNNQVFTIFVLLIRDGQSIVNILVISKDLYKKVLTNLKLRENSLVVSSSLIKILRAFLMNYCPTKYEHKQWLSYAVVEQATHENWLDSLCYFVWMRQRHNKPVIYNYTTRRVASLLKCSPTTIAHHVNILLQKDLCTLTGGHLLLKSNRQLKKGSFLMPVGISRIKSEQRNFLRFTLIKRNLHSQYRVYTEKNNALLCYRGDFRGLTSKAIKARLRKTRLKYPDSKKLERSINNTLTLSNTSFGNICNRSQSTGVKIQKALNSLELILSYKRSQLQMKDRVTRKRFFDLALNSAHFHSKGGQVFKRLSNGIIYPSVCGSISTIAITEQAS